ncbi:MAG: helix-turn-helix domain-containing protein [Actinomycetota bacterium]
MPVATPPDGDVTLREQLSNLRALLTLSMLMTEHADEGAILHLAATAVPSLGRCRTEGVYLDGGWHNACDSLGSGVRRRLEAQLAALDVDGGQLEIPGRSWGWGYPLSRRGGAHGHMVVGAAEAPPEHEQFLLTALAQQTSVALANARLRAGERKSADDLRRALEALRHRTEIHERLTRVALAGEGQEGIARAVHELTGYPVAIEDRYGNLTAWAGPDRPDPYLRDFPTHRDHLLRRALQAEGPLRDQGRLVALARLGDDVLGVLALIDPDGTAGEQERVTLGHAATVLAKELARLRNLAETELRLRRDLVEELLAGADDEGALHRAQVLDYDLGRTHRVVVVDGGRSAADHERFFHAVRRAARDVGLGSLLVARPGAVVVLADTEGLWEAFRGEILMGLGRGACRIGVGGPCERPRDFSRSYREAQLALKMQKATGSQSRVTVYEDLGIYQVLCEVPDTDSVERLVRRWLSPLLDHDAANGSQLVATLSGYLECGGNYDAAAKALSVHRSTLRYRLQQIRDISGYDLRDPDTHFNLHLGTRAWRTLQAMRGP